MMQLAQWWNCRRAMKIIKRLEADPNFVAKLAEAERDMAEGQYYAWDLDNGYHGDLRDPIPGCDCLACKQHNS